MYTSLAASYPITYTLPSLDSLNDAIRSAQRTGAMLEEIGRNVWDNTDVATRDSRFFKTIESKILPRVGIVVNIPWKPNGEQPRDAAGIPILAADAEVRSSLPLPKAFVNWYVRRLTDEYQRYSADRHRGYHT